MEEVKLKIDALKHLEVGFIGLGVMGYQMAAWTAKAGFSVSVYNRSSNVSEKWVKKFGGKNFSEPSELAETCDVVFICVGRDEDVLEVTSGKNGIFHTIKPGSLIVDHSTTSANLSRELGAIANQLNCNFMDAPVSGGEKGAIDGKLAIMCGGSSESFNLAKSIMECYATKISLMGPHGSGQLCKMVNQICIAGLLQGLSEGVNFAKNAGLDVEQVIEIISKGAAQSWQLDNRAVTMYQDKFDFGFAVKWMRKDLDYACAEALKNSSPLPITGQILGYYEELEQAGDGELDTSSLIRRLR